MFQMDTYPNLLDRNEPQPRTYLYGCKSFYACYKCNTHLADHDQLVSRTFQGSHSRAYLFHTVVNVIVGPSSVRNLNTGVHTVADIFCHTCKRAVGWKYLEAEQESQRYKVGKCILELFFVCRENHQMEVDMRDSMLRNRQQVARRTIGQMHRGSLSPPTSQASSGPWSSSSSSTNNHEPVMIKYGKGAATANEENGADEENEEEEECLMFPIQDDIIGQRASYNDLAHIRGRSLDKQKRRSMVFESKPYDWKYSSISRPNSLASSEAGLSPNSLANLEKYRHSSDEKQKQESKSLSTSPSATRHTNPSQARPQSITASETQFSMDPCEPSTSSVGTSIDESIGSKLNDQRIDTKNQTKTKNSDQEQSINSQPHHQGGAPDALKVSDMSQSEALAGAGSAAASTSHRQAGQISRSESGSLNLDEEVFYDCCSDHLVVNNAAVSTS